MYAVMGATGKVGGSVAEELLRQGKKVRAVVRSPEKGEVWQERGTEIAIAEYHDEDALAAAFRGAEGVFVMVPPNIAPAPGYPDSMAIVSSIRAALEAEKPDRYVALSTIGAELTNFTGLLTPLHALEDELGALHIPAAFLRAAWFMENYLWDIPVARETGEMHSFLHPLNKQFPMVAAADIGLIAAQTLVQQWKYTRYIEVWGPRMYSSDEIAAVVAEVLGRDVVAVDVPREDWQQMFVQQGMPADRTHARIEMLDALNSGQVRFDQLGTERATGGTDFRAALREMVHVE